jgi:phosphoenolpyruvate-protein kinase (PTS system EI component)
MYGTPSGPLSELAATAGLRTARLVFGQQRLFSAAMRAIRRAESAGDQPAR